MFCVMRLDLFNKRTSMKSRTLFSRSILGRLIFCSLGLKFGLRGGCIWEVVGVVFYFLCLCSHFVKGCGYVVFEGGFVGFV
jgi:hypothetical protein